MKNISLLALSLGVLSVANAATFTLTDGNSVVNGDDAIGLYDWFTDGTDHLYNQDYFWRVGNTAEQRQGAIGPGVITQFAPNIANVKFTAAGLFSIDITYTLIGGANGSGTSDIGEVVRIRNLTNQALDFHLFEYDDFDILGTAGGDTAFFDGNIVTQFEMPVVSMVGTVPTANRWQIGPFPGLLNDLNDGVATNLTNGVTPSGPGDMTFAFQWDRTIAANGNFIMSKNKRIETVPEPATMAALGLGLAALARRRRSK
ncbi:MAG: PEP-CTERM sorting domain-containing protein [Chthonomonas sp.]|nr:PEP-CTERM sorting domain-containing protein [Chthonomonas sp.]